MTRPRSAHATSVEWVADWRARANCRDQDPELFFPVGDGQLAQMQIRQAKDVCLCCDVSEQCLAWALEEKVTHGIFGGLTEKERAALLRRRARRGRR